MGTDQSIYEHRWQVWRINASGKWAASGKGGRSDYPPRVFDSWDRAIGYADAAARNGLWDRFSRSMSEK